MDDMADSKVLPPLAIELSATRPTFIEGERVELRATYRNTSNTTLALTFWWSRRMRIVDESGEVVAPGPGPVLPCGIPEQPQAIEPGKSLVREEPLVCTQPAGDDEVIGWSYALRPGRYRVVLIFACLRAQGFPASTEGWPGWIESGTAEFEIVAKPGWLSQRFGAGKR